jgi:hypothetical protein
MNLLVLEVELPNDPKTKPRARRLDPVGITREETPTGRASSNSTSTLYYLYLSQMLGSREKIHTRDLSHLILSGNNDLGFQGMPPPGARGPPYIAP